MITTAGRATVTTTATGVTAGTDDGDDANGSHTPTTGLVTKHVDDNHTMLSG